MQNKVILILLFIFNNIIINAQSTTQSQKFQIERSATIDVSAIKTDWWPAVQNIEMPKPDGEKESSELEKVKRIISKRFPQNKSAKRKSGTKADAPYLKQNFMGNNYVGFVPNDNSLAVSNNGRLISTINSNLNVFDIAQDSLIKNVSLASFTAPLALSGNKYDAKVLYDDASSRFIFVCLNGTVAANSKIVVAFSNTNDPAGTWNLYALNGNPLNDTTWSDFPSIAISDNELFITVNSIVPNLPWQIGFKQTLIWQLNKNDGYNGIAINSRLWSGIKFGASTQIRNLNPIGGGSKSYGKNMYLLSNRNFAVQNDTIFILELTGEQSDPGTILKVNFALTDLPYGVAPDARQAGGQTFATNDARVLGGFLENGIIQFVSNAVDTNTGFAAVYHGIINNLLTSPSVKGHIIGDNIRDFGFANISYTGSSSTDNSSIISLNHSAPTVFAGFSAVKYDTDYSAPLLIKSGDNFVDAFTTATSERWGDYSGSQRKYDEPGTVWVSGSFGTAAKKNGTWIAELSINDPSSINTSKPAAASGFAYPNPSKDRITVNFVISQRERVFFEIYSVEGKLVKVLMDDVIKKGENIFTFSTAPLDNGIYFLNIRTEGATVLNQKIIKN